MRKSGCLQLPKSASNINTELLSAIKTMKNYYYLSFLLLAPFLCADARDYNECVYTMYVKTGSIIKGGTDSNISVTLSDAKGNSVWVPSLKTWGVMGSGHDYLERGNLDAFSGRGPCIAAPLCRLNLTSDGSGHHHGWYCDYVEVTSTGPHKPCSQTFFYVDQWLAGDVAPYNLTAVLNECRKAAVARRGRFIVGNPKPSAA